FMRTQPVSRCCASGQDRGAKTMSPQGRAALAALCGVVTLVWGIAGGFDSPRIQDARAPIVSRPADSVAANAEVEPAAGPSVVATENVPSVVTTKDALPVVAAEDAPPVVASEDARQVMSSEHARQPPPSEEPVAAADP